MKLKFHFHQNVVNDSVDIYLFGEDSSGKRFAAKPMKLEFEEYKKYSISAPTLVIEGFQSKDFLISLANALAESGYRHESTDAGELKATKSHLADMRTIALETVELARKIASENRIAKIVP